MKKFIASGLAAMALCMSSGALAQNVGIGLTDPAARLHIANGILRIDSSRIGLVNTGHNVFIGDSSGINTINTMAGGIENTGIGQSALYSNTTGFRNTANGRLALYSNTTGAGSTANGYQALYGNNMGNLNTANGYKALQFNNSGSRNTANGYSALLANSSGISNTANGAEAFALNSIGSFNTANGAEALFSNNSGFNNTANGFQALRANNSGFNNTANGYRALYSNTSSHSNTANGYQALFSNTSGAENIAIGRDALHENLAGSNNTVMGYGAMYYALFSNNTALGASAGTDSDSSNTCTYLGYDADNDTYLNAYTNSTAIGNGARMISSNEVRIGNNAVTSIGGYANWSNVSDGRYKTGVEENVPGLEFITRLRPVTYHLDAHKLAGRLNEDQKDRRGDATQNQPDVARLRSRDAKAAIVETGFIAQEVEAVAQALGYDFSGIDGPKDSDGLYGLRYATFVVPLVKAVQEQQGIIEAQQLELDALRSSHEDLKSRLERLEAGMK